MKPRGNISLTCDFVSGPKQNSNNSEYIISAFHLHRPKHGGKKCAYHHAIMIRTNLDNYYLIHSIPAIGNTIGETNLSAKWETVGPLYIRNVNERRITLNQLLYEGSGFGLGKMNYFTGGTCWGTFYKIKFFLLFGYSFDKILFWFLIILLCLIVLIFFAISWRKQEKARKKREELEKT